MPSIVVRGLILDRDDRILLVTHAPEAFWYTPGGHLEGNESLVDCLVRELREEAGIDAETSGIVLIDQVVEHEHGEHKLEIYFLARTAATLPEGWGDEHGPVQRVAFFAPDELAALPNVFPTVLTPDYVRALASGSVAAIAYRDVRPLGP